jgi:hypothetical protein
MGGTPVTVAGTEDATETIKLAAIRRLAESSFQEKVRSSDGIAWGAVQYALASYLPGTIGNPGQWVHDQKLVWRALNEILGPGGWTTAKRKARTGAPRKVSWIFSTPEAKPRAAGVPALPPDWAPGDEYGPPPEGEPF